MKTPKKAHKAISRETHADMLHTHRFEAYQSGRLSVYMEDVVSRLERMQQGKTEEEEKSRWLTKKKQQIWDDQYKKHHGHIASQKVRYEATFILEETLGLRPETPLLDDIATPEQLQKLKEEQQEMDDI